MASPWTCACCLKPAEGQYAIHRDGFGYGPEVHLCTSCGSQMEPTCEKIWASIKGNLDSKLIKNNCYLDQS